jgi:hypothetical protein
VLFCLKTETKPSSETSCFFKEFDDVQKNKIMSVNFSHAVLFHLSIHVDLAVQALVWQSMVVLHT